MPLDEDKCRRSICPMGIRAEGIGVMTRSRLEGSLPPGTLAKRAVLKGSWKRMQCVAGYLCRFPGWVRFPHPLQICPMGHPLRGPGSQEWCIDLKDRCGR